MGMDVDKNSTNRRREKSGQYLQEHYERRNNAYTIVPAVTPELKHIFFQLRYMVFMEEYSEFHFDRKIHKIETDDYDKNALHLLLMHEILKLFVGGGRLILPQKEKKNFGLQSLNIPDSPFLKDFPYDLSRFGEVSRFMVSKNQMRIVRQLTSVHSDDSDEYAEYAGPLHCIFRGLLKSCKDNGLIGVIATLTPLFIKVAKRLGLNLILHGSPIEYHGTRQCTYIVIQDYLEWLRGEYPKNYHYFMEYLA